MIKIDCSGAGALMHGTEREDNDLLRPIGWRWSWKMQCLYLARSLRPETVDLKVRETLKVLAGREVEVTGQDERESDEERAVRLDQRDRDLVGVHERRAERAHAEGDRQHARFREISDMIPLGQPVLLGHHSQRRHQKDLARIDTALGKSVEAWREGKAEERLAASAAARVAARERRAEGDPFRPDDLNVGDIIRTTWQDAALVMTVSAKSVTIPSSMLGLPNTDALPYKRVLGVVAEATDETRAAVKAAKAQVREYRAWLKLPERKLGDRFTPTATIDLSLSRPLNGAP